MLIDHEFDVFTIVYDGYDSCGIPYCGEPRSKHMTAKAIDSTFDHYNHVLKNHHLFIDSIFHVGNMAVVKVACNSCTFTIKETHQERG